MIGFLSKFKIYIYAALVVFVALVFIYSQQKRIEMLDLQVSSKVAIIEQREKDYNDLLDMYNKEIEISNRLHELQVSYEQKIREKDDEIKNLSDSVSNGSKRLLVNAKCPSVPKTEGAEPTGGEPAELDEGSRQAYFDLRRNIMLYEEMYNLCIATLRSYSK